MTVRPWLAQRRHWSQAQPRLPRQRKSPAITTSQRSTEIGYWFDYCFPIFDKSRRVQQLGLFVVNVTAERTSAEILNALASNSKVRRAQAAGILERFDESVRAYHSHLRISLSKLACPSMEAARKADDFRLSLEHLDEDIRLMQELIYAVIAQLPVPEC